MFLGLVLISGRAPTHTAQPVHRLSDVALLRNSNAPLCFQREDGSGGGQWVNGKASEVLDKNICGFDSLSSAPTPSWCKSFKLWPASREQYGHNVPKLQSASGRNSTRSCSYSKLPVSFFSPRLLVALMKCSRDQVLRPGEGTDLDLGFGLNRLIPSVF